MILPLRHRDNRKKFENVQKSIFRASAPLRWTTVFGLLVFASCSNKLDLLDNWKETTVVYGLLNESDTVQYIKIYKAYLGEGNALQMAQNYDSIAYANQLIVQMEKWSFGTKIATYTLQKDSSISKVSGTFSYPKQIAFTTNAVLDENTEYHLIITNKSTGNVVKSKTGLVRKFAISSPSSSGAASFWKYNAPPQKIKWVSAVNGKLYQLVIRFHYDEVAGTAPIGMATPKYVDWVFPSQTSINTAGGASMEASFLNEDFYKFIKGTITTNSDVKRFPKKIDYIFSVAAEEFDTYMQVYQPSNSIVQEKPDYTNIENGLGLFSSRLNITVSKDSLNTRSIDSLCGGIYTSNLGFCNNNVQSPYHCN